jgi:hypothetical protein
MKRFLLAISPFKYSVHLCELGASVALFAIETQSAQKYILF